MNESKKDIYKAPIKRFLQKYLLAIIIGIVVLTYIISLLMEFFDSLSETPVGHE
jgi:hypothetical protein